MGNKPYMQWWRDARFGMMIHWGLYAKLGGEYRGQRMDYIGEWIQSRFRIPQKEYELLAKDFYASKFDAKEWVSLAKAAGMKYIIVTAKHHEGFAMYHSHVDSYNIYGATPFHRDPLKELADECKKEGIKLGFYYSQALDWHDPNGGGQEGGHTNFGMSWTNDWDYPDNEHKNFDQYFYSKSLPQIRELLTNYGEVALFWFDTPLTISEKQCQEIYDLVKELQPNCIVNSRLGKGFGDYSSLGDNMIPDSLPPGDYEVAATLNDTWGYKSFDTNWKKGEDIVRLLSSLCGRGVNYLLNVGPDGEGAIPEAAKEVLFKVGAWVHQNESFVYGSVPSVLKGKPIDGSITQKGNNLYLCLRHPVNQIVLNGILGNVESVFLLKDGSKLPFTQKFDDTHPLVLDCRAIKEENQVVVIAFSKKVELDGRLIEQGDGITLKAKDGVIAKMADEEEQRGEKHYAVDGTVIEEIVPFVSEIGSVAAWLSTNYEIEWDFELFTPGKYEIGLNFIDFMHSHPLKDGHEVRITLEEETFSSPVVISENTTDPVSPYYQSGLAKLGTVKLKHPGHYRLHLRPTKISRNDDLGFCLSAAVLKRK